MKIEFPKIEQEILKFWEKNQIFKKSISSRKKRKRFVFYEGPPYANGKPGIHHLLARAFKDIILRYKTMRGFLVERKAGWDTHGLPTEIAAEKNLKIKTKKEIEKLGIERFIKECKRNIFLYKKEWEKFTKRIGYWIDLKNPYITCSNKYIESLWWIIKQFYQKGFLQKRKKVVPWCPRCQTSLSSHELAQGYKRITEPAIYIKFRLKNFKSNHYLLVWTTTPWTLPANIAIAINPKIEYLSVKINKEFLILAKERLKEILKKEEYKIEQRFKGEELIGLKYEPLYKISGLKTKNSKFNIVLSASFVSLKEGTGLVHIAPAFGQEDYELCLKNNLISNQEVPLTVDEEGKMKKGVIGEGKFVKQADQLIIEDLKKRKILFKKELYSHDYPFCWRCETPLLYYLHSCWFVQTTKVKKELIQNNQKINWIPSFLKEGRFGKWLEEVKDWNFSRERYWGTPLPVWECQQKNKKCKNIKVIGSLKELERLSKKKIKELHRPYVDKITFKCQKCAGIMRRVSEVVDVWFDSGSMPFAQFHYPFESKNFIDKKIFFPADFICEGIDQTRGWFFTLLAVSTLLGFGFPFRNVISLGIVLDEKGQKMSKSKGNIVDPWLMSEKYGVDSLRWYFYTINQPAVPKLFSEKEIKICLRKFLLTFWNCYKFFESYSLEISKFNNLNLIRKKTLLDRWILSRLNNLIRKVTKSLDDFDVVKGARLLEKFIIEDFSLWYIRRSRERFQKPKSKLELKKASTILGFILFNLSKLTAPFIPFLSEKIYQQLKNKIFDSKLPLSVHLTQWPKVNKNFIDKKLEKNMDQVRKIVKEGLALRMKKGIKVRQPLLKLKFKNQHLSTKKELLLLIKKELNVKKVIFDPKIQQELALDTKITHRLKNEGEIREIIRHLQYLRKKAGLTPKDKILIYYQGDREFVKIFREKKSLILKETRAKEIKKDFLVQENIEKKKKIKIGNKNILLMIKKVN